MRHQLFRVNYRIGETFLLTGVCFNTSVAIGFSFQKRLSSVVDTLIIHLLFVEVFVHRNAFRFEVAMNIETLWEKIVAICNGAIVSDDSAVFRSEKDSDHYHWILRHQRVCNDDYDDYWGSSDDECEDQYPYEDYE